MGRRSGPRLLHRQLGYTSRIEKALPSEPEAISAAEQERMSQRARDAERARTRDAWTDANRQINDAVSTFRERTGVFCRRHEQLAAVHGEQALRTGSYAQRRRKPRDEMPLVLEASPVSTNGAVIGDAISPAEVRPRLAAMTAQSVSELQRALLDAATGATREHWTTQ